MRYASREGRHGSRWVILLAALLDKHADHDHIAERVLGSLWVLELPKQAGGELLPEHAHQFECRHEDNDPLRLHLSWSGFGREAMPTLSASARVRFDPAARASRFSIRVQGLDGVVPLVERRTDLAYIRQLVQWRQAALPYLLHGTFLRPPRMNITEMEIDVSRLSIYAGQQGAVQEYRKRVPQYLAGAWRAEGGSIAVAVANIADMDHQICFTLSRGEHGLPDRGRVYKRRAAGRTQIGLFENGQATITDTLAAAGAVIYEVVGT
jgi:hypothetical protein